MGKVITESFRLREENDRPLGQNQNIVVFNSRSSFADDFPV